VAVPRARWYQVTRLALLLEPETMRGACLVASEKELDGFVIALNAHARTLPLVSRLCIGRVPHRAGEAREEQRFEGNSVELRRAAPILAGIRDRSAFAARPRPNRGCSFGCAEVFAELARDFAGRGKSVTCVVCLGDPPPLHARLRGTETSGGVCDRG